MTNKFAIVFPGQGSQSVGMLADIAAQFPVVQQTFDQASAALDYDLWQLVQAGPAEKLDTTMHTQPALLAASYAIWRIIQNNHAIKPTFFAGHSLGEYTALVCANAISFADAIKLVAARGEYMQAAVPTGVGAMAAIIGLDDAVVKDICEQASATNEMVTPANFNSIGQVVVAGNKAAVERAVALATEKGSRMAKLIPVSVPSHCQLMQPAAVRLEKLLASITIKQPEIPVINNVDVKPYSDANAIRDGLVRQLAMPVRWVDTIQYFVQHGVTHIIECGPGKVLTGLNKRIDKSLELLTTADLASMEALLKLEREGSA